jgi:glycosyltransferase involved in cell wall biosynthesis
LDGLGRGGAEAFIMNIYRNIDRDRVQFDFLLRSRPGNVYVDEVEQLGSHVHFTSSFPRHALKNYEEVAAFFRNHTNYRIIHLHANALLYVLPLFITRKKSITCKVLHSHSTKSMNRLFDIVHHVNRPLANRVLTDRFACSMSAGKWMFGSRKFRVINNAIDTNAFRYNPVARARMRASLDVEDRLVVGHVGRMVASKNHSFMLCITKELRTIAKDVVLVLVGDGPLKEDVQKQIVQLGLERAVVLTGTRADAADIMQAFDVFLFPSIYEGSPFTLIEAQASGLPCVISNAITDEVVATDLVEKVSLDESAITWASKVLEVYKSRKRCDTFTQMCRAGRDVKTTARWLEEFYLARHGENLD